MQVITLSQIKTYLGIADTTQDAALTAVLPALDAKVKEITRRPWNRQASANIYGTEYMEVTSDDVDDYMAAGTEVEGDGIPADTYVEELYTHNVTVGGKTYTAPVVKLSNTATAYGTKDVTFGFNRAYQPVVAKLAWWMVGERSTTINELGVASKSMGPVSVTYSSGDLDGRFGVPGWCVQGLPRYGRGY